MRICIVSFYPINIPSMFAKGSKNNFFKKYLLHNSYFFKIRQKIKYFKKLTCSNSSLLLYFYNPQLVALYSSSKTLETWTPFFLKVLNFSKPNMLLLVLNTMYFLSSLFCPPYMAELFMSVCSCYAIGKQTRLNLKRRLFWEKLWHQGHVIKLWVNMRQKSSKKRTV